MEFKKGSFIKLSDIGIGKVENTYDDNCIVINIADTKYYRYLDTDAHELEETTEKEYINFLKAFVKELTAKSTSKRKEAANYNKSVDGEATKRKGKVGIINGNYSNAVCENAFSSHHRSLLSDAKKTKELKDKLKKEIAHYKEMEKYRKEREKALKAV